MAIFNDLYEDTGSNPYAFFSTAAGPDTSDLYGPPMNVLDTYLDGTPVAQSEQYLQNAAPSGSGTFGLRGFFARADVKAALVFAAGVTMLHLHMNS